MTGAEKCGARGPAGARDVVCKLERGHDGDHYAEVEGAPPVVGMSASLYIKWSRENAPTHAEGKRTGGDGK